MKTHLIVPDCHYPAIDKTCLKLIHKIIKEIKPDGVTFLGDMLDAAQISTYDKSPDKKNLLMEDIEGWNNELTKIGKLMKRGSTMNLIIGNHCFRLQRYISRQARELHGMIPDWHELFKIAERNKQTDLKWVLHPYEKWNSCVIGDCTLTHGFIYSANTATAMLTKYKRNIVQGHNHRIQAAYDSDYYAISLGHISNEKETAHNPCPTGWKQALGLLHVDSRGKTFFDIIPISNGRMVVYGKAISV